MMNDRGPRRRRGKILIALFAATASFAAGTQALAPSTAAAVQAECTDGTQAECDQSTGGGSDTAGTSGTSDSSGSPDSSWPWEDSSSQGPTQQEIEQQALAKQAQEKRELEELDKVLAADERAQDREDAAAVNQDELDQLRRAELNTCTPSDGYLDRCPVFCTPPGISLKEVNPPSYMGACMQPVPLPSWDGVCLTDPGLPHTGSGLLDMGFVPDRWDPGIMGNLPNCRDSKPMTLEEASHKTDLCRRLGDTLDSVQENLKGLKGTKGKALLRRRKKEDDLRDEFHQARDAWREGHCSAYPAPL